MTICSKKISKTSSILNFLQKMSRFFGVKLKRVGYPAGHQAGITCEAIDDPRKSSKAIDKHVIINFRDKNVVIARFRDKKEVFI